MPQARVKQVNTYINRDPNPHNLPLLPVPPINNTYASLCSESEVAHRCRESDCAKNISFVLPGSQFAKFCDAWASDLSVEDGTYKSEIHTAHSSVKLSLRLHPNKIFSQSNPDLLISTNHIISLGD